MQSVFSGRVTFWLRGSMLCLGLLSQQATAQTPASNAGASCPALLSKTFRRLQDEALQNLCQYSGKVLLVVNTASYCGFTFQYEGLERLHAELKAKGLVVLGFPSNDFGQLEPGSNKQIADFCVNTYGVKFPMFEKSVVSGASANALYRELALATGKAPQWNFHKYLIDRKGQIVRNYASSVSPQDKRLYSDIEHALGGN